MKKAWLLLLPLTLWATTAFAQQEIRDGQKLWRPQGILRGGITRTDSVYHVQGTDANGNPYVLDADRDRDLNGFVPGGQNAINDTLGVGSSIAMAANPGGETFTAESTAVLSVGPYRWLAISVRVIPAAGDTSTKITLALQIRQHDTNSADSSSTHAWYGWQFQGTVAGADSLGQNFAPPVGAGVGVWASEKLIGFLPAQGRGDMKANQFFGMPNGLYLPLNGSRGEPFHASYMSVRVRCLTGAAKPRVILSVVGGS